MTTKKQSVICGKFNYYETLRHLHHANLLIHTIPGEEWTLSCFVHSTLLVDVYTLTGKIKGKTNVCLQCGRLSELLIKFLRYGRKAQYHPHASHSSENNISAITRHASSGLLAPTFEEDAFMRLRDGDIIFRLIPNESWRLTNTNFGQGPTFGSEFLYLAEEHTFGTPNLRIYKGRLEHVLLEFLCQNSTFVEKQGPSKVLAFKTTERQAND